MPTAIAADELGIRYFVGKIPAAATRVIEQARARRGGYACLCNVHVLMAADRDSRLASALHDAWTVFPDGAPLAWLQRRTHRHASRVAGADLLCAVADRGRTQSIRHLFFGSSRQVVDAAVARLEEMFPGIAVVGAIAPPIAPVEELGHPYILEINRSNADIVWCGLGAPKQELWMHRFAQELDGAVVLGVGAAFDFLAGKKRRAPLWMQRSGLEWLYRLASEPRRLGLRYMTTNTRFVVRVLGDLLGEFRSRPARRRSSASET